MKVIGGVVERSYFFMELEMVSMKETRAVAWHLYWRLALTGIIMGPIIGFIFGFLGGYVYGIIAYPEAKIETAQLIGGTMGLLGGMIFAYLALNYFISRLIDKRVRGKKLALIDMAS